MQRQLTPILLVVAFGIFTLLSSVFVIDEGELAIVTQFGEYKRTADQAGLHFRIPFVQQVNRMERRIMGSDNPPSSYLTKDKKFLVVDPITRWRIADPLKFFTTVRDEIGAKARIDDIINSELRRELARNEFGEIVCVPEGASTIQLPTAPLPKPQDDADEPDEANAEAEPAGATSDDAAEDDASDEENPEVAPPPPAPPASAAPERGAPREKECGRESVMASVTARVVEQTERYGILVLDVRMKRTDLPTEVQESVFQRMRAERERVAKRYRSEGEEEAQKIRAETDKEVRLTIAEAYEKAQTARGRGDAESISIYAKAYGKDPEFYAFIRALETYEQAITKQSSVVLSTGSPLFKYLENPATK
jgi:membrane protease subunit HflC